MTDNEVEAIRKDLHPNAKEAARVHIRDFATSLLLQAKTIAYRQKADEVLSIHINEALRLINVEQKRIWTRELAVIIGGVTLGVFIQGFITELSTGNTLLMGVYTILGFLGMLSVFWGLQR